MRGQISLEFLICFLAVISLISVFLGVQNDANLKIGSELNDIKVFANQSRYDSRCFLGSMNKDSLKMSAVSLIPGKCLYVYGGKRWFQS